MMHTLLMALICFIAVGVGSLICQVVSVSLAHFNKNLFNSHFCGTKSQNTSLSKQVSKVGLRLLYLARTLVMPNHTAVLHQ